MQEICHQSFISGSDSTLVPAHCTAGGQHDESAVDFRRGRRQIKLKLNLHFIQKILILEWVAG
jgi:hypothetical protein